MLHTLAGKYVRQHFPELLLTLAVVGMATGMLAWTSVPLGLLCVYLLLATPSAIIKKRLSAAPLFWVGLLIWLWITWRTLEAANPAVDWQYLIRNSAWVGVPFCFTVLTQLKVQHVFRIVFCFILALAVVSLFCFAVQLVKVVNGAPPHSLFYHDLLSPFRLHAVLFSVYIIFCLLYWLYHFNVVRLSKWSRQALHCSILWLMLCVLLLSSKLCIILGVAIAVWFVGKQWHASPLKKTTAVASVLFCSFLLLYIPNPVQRRFADVRLNVQKTWLEEKFTAAHYLDGLSFRLLQWRWVPQALNEEGAWFAGVGAAQAQAALNKQYVQAGLYMGDGTQHQQGYGAFNTHNSFLQVLLEQGVVGLGLFATYLMLLFRRAWLQKNKSALLYLFVLIAFCLTDAPTGTQAGLMLLLLLPQLLFLDNDQ